MTGRGMDDQAGRLVDHRQPFVLVHDDQLDGRCRTPRRCRDRGGKGDLDPVVTSDPLTRPAGAEVDPHRPGGDEGLRRVTGDPALPGQPEVEADGVVDRRRRAHYPEAWLSWRMPSWYTTTSMPPTIPMSATLKIWNSQKWVSMKSTT